MNQVANNVLLHSGKYKKTGNYDKQVKSLLKNFDSLSIDTISVLLKLPKCRVSMVCDSLEKFGEVESFHRQTRFVRLYDGEPLIEQLKLSREKKVKT